MGKLFYVKCCIYWDGSKTVFRLDDTEIHNPIAKWFVRQYNKACIPINNQGDSHDFGAWFVFHNFKELFRTYKYWFCQKEYIKDPNELKYPLIHLTWLNVFKESGKENYGDEVKCSKNEEWLLSGLQRYKKIMDSSIWNYYVPVFKSLNTQGTEIDLMRFHNVLLDISANYRIGRYDLSISQEYADLHARLLEQSYLEGSHKAVSPYLFHSEYEMKGYLQGLRIDREYGEKKKVIDEVKKYKWRFLLLDDKSVNQMTGMKNQKTNKCKVQILHDNLHRILGFDEEKIWFRVLDFEEVRKSNEDCRIIDKKSHIIIEDASINMTIEPDNYGRVVNGVFDDKTTKKFMPTDHDSLSNVNDFQIVVDCVEHVDEALYCLQKYRYDIVLIDYLLYKDKIKGEHKQEYGYQLLEELWKWHKMGNDNTCQYMIGPNNSLTIMFISAFTTAVNERLLEMGLGRSEPGLWYIGNSACPTNTPYLFSYLLLQLMRHRIKDLSEQSEKNVLSIVDLLESIYVNPNTTDGRPTKVREAAHSRFNQLLFMRDKYRRIENDLEKKDEQHLREKPNDAEYIMNMPSSLLVYSAFNVVHHFSGAFFDHLQHLVYLTAFGTIRQSDEMDTELNNVYKELVEYDDIKSNVYGKRIKNGRIVCDAIRRYIVELENNLIK